MTEIKRGIPLGQNPSDRFAACKALTRSINNAYRETPRYMGVRELVQNSIDAIIRQQRIEPDFQGRIVVGPYWENELGRHGNKLCVADNGISMSPADVQEHLNNLHNSGNDAGHELAAGTSTHKGQGAKTSLLPANQYGMEYFLLQKGVVPLTCNLWCNKESYDGDHVYELEAITHDGNCYGEADESEMMAPMFKNFILETGHGTIVKLNGNSEEESTIASDDILGPFNSTTYALIKLLESRYWKVPENIAISVMREQSDGNVNQDSNRVSGAHKRLKTICEENNHGSIDLTTEDGLPFTLYWYLTRDQKDAQNSRSKFNSGAHVGLLDNNEIYFDFNKLNNSQYRLKQLRLCGIYGNTAHNVVLYIEPKFKVHPNGVRTQLVYQTPEREGELVEVNDFASVISENLPQVIVDAMNAESTTSNSKTRQKIERYLKILERKTDDTLKEVLNGSTGIVDDESFSKIQQGVSGGGGAKKNKGGNVTRRRRVRESGLVKNANKISSLNIPEVKWTSMGEGTNNIACAWDNNVVVCNRDWAFHESQIDALMKVVRPKIESAPIEFIRSRVTDWYESTQGDNILMTIANIQRLREQNVLSSSDLEEYKTDSALTAAMFFNFSLLEQAERSAITTIMK